jgi:hypothetical protein
MLITAGVLITVMSLRSEALTTYEEQQEERCKVKNHDWLRARTLHVRGLFPKDRRGDMLRNELDTLLKPVNGKVLDVVVTPDFQDLFALESEKKDLDDLHTMVEAQDQGFFTKCCLKMVYRSGRNQNVLESRQEEVSNLIDKEIEKPFLSSGHAFVVVDSVLSLNYCLMQTRITPSYAWKLAKLSFKEDLKQIMKKNLQKNPS